MEVTREAVRRAVGLVVAQQHGVPDRVLFGDGLPARDVARAAAFLTGALLDALGESARGIVLESLALELAKADADEAQP